MSAIKRTFGFGMLEKFRSEAVQKQLKEDQDLPFYELNYIKVNSGSEKEFHEEMKVNHEIKKEQLSVQHVHYFKSFAAFTKGKAKNMFIELVLWENIPAFNQSRSQLPAPTTYRIMESIRMRPADLQSYDLDELISTGNAIEFGARFIKPKTRHLFPEEREKFLSNIIVQPGYKFDREFVSIDEGLGIIVFGWETAKNYINAGNKVKKSPRLLAKTLWYFRLVKNRAFQVAQPV